MADASQLNGRCYLANVSGHDSAVPQGSLVVQQGPVAPTNPSALADTTERPPGRLLSKCPAFIDRFIPVRSPLRSRRTIAAVMTPHIPQMREFSLAMSDDVCLPNVPTALAGCRSCGAACQAAT